MQQLTQQQGMALVAFARQIIEEKLGLDATNPPSAEIISDPVFSEKRGVFVTLHKDKALRGCIGSLVAVESILDGVKRHALNAAFHDHRFKPVTAEEIEKLHVEVSVLTLPQDVSYSSTEELLQKIVPEQDGVILRGAGGESATFLPQVWKQLPDANDFFSHLCRKAGLPMNYWQLAEPEIQIYQVQLFDESP